MTKFQGLTKEEKVEHIWEYYKLHIIGVVVGIVLVFTLLINIFSPKPPESVANVVVMGTYTGGDEQIDQFTNNIKGIIDQGESGLVNFNIFPVDWSQETQLTMAMNQKLMLLLQAQELDVLIIEKEKFDTYVDNLESAIFTPLEGIAELGQILEVNKENLVMVQFPEDDKEKIYGLFVGDNIKLKDIGIAKDYVISIPLLAKNPDHAVEVIKWLHE